MNYQRILVTGGAGFIGSHIVDHLVKLKKKVRILDNLHSQIHLNGKPPLYLNSHAEFIKGDVTNRNDWQKSLKDIEVVIHFAAAVGVGQSMYQIERYVRDNSLGTAILLDILANERHKVKKMLIAASMSSFGEGMYKCPGCHLLQQPQLRLLRDLQKCKWEPSCINCAAMLQPMPTSEEAKLQSPSVYAITKKNQEDLMMSVGKAYRIPVVSLRFFNAFGTRQSLSNPYNGVAAIFLSRVKNNKQPIINEDGAQTRDFIHIKDIVNAVELCIKNSKADYEIFNVGSGIPITINDVAKTVLSLCDSRITPQLTGKFRPFDIRHCYADISKLTKLLGWKPRISFRDGMFEVYEWSKRETAVDLVDDALGELSKRQLQ